LIDTAIVEGEEEDEKEDDDDVKGEREKQLKPATATVKAPTSTAAGPKKASTLDRSLKALNDDAETTTRTAGTVDGSSMFSDRYSLTVSHHQKVSVVKPTSRHAEAVQQLRQTRREHQREQLERQDQQPQKTRYYMATSSSGSSSTSWSSVSTSEPFTFYGNLQAVAADLSYFLQSITNSLAEPHNANPCYCPTPTEISYPKTRHQNDQHKNTKKNTKKKTKKKKQQPEHRQRSRSRTRRQ
jgi:hypothetical protein